MIQKLKPLFALSLLASISFTFNVQAAGVNINELYKNAYDATINAKNKGTLYGIKGPLNNETQTVLDAVKSGMQVDIMNARAKINLLPNSLLQSKRTFSSILDQFQHPVYERSVFLLDQANMTPNQQLLNSVRFLIKDIPANFKSCYSSAADQIQGKMFKIANDLAITASKTRNEEDINKANNYINQLKTSEFITIDIENFLNGLSNKVSNKPDNNSTQNTGYKINELKNLESVAWLNTNEVLTLSKKYVFNNPGSNIQVRYCNVYNLDTKTLKPFTQADISWFHGASPDGKYVLYSEPKYIPIGDEWQKACNSGELFHHSIKLLNLTNGEITSLKTEYENSDTQFFWISKDKVLINYYNHWTIVNVEGKVIEEGSYTSKKEDSARISGFDIKDNLDSVDGKIYYTLDKTRPNGGSIGVTLCSIDIKTKSTNSIFYNEKSLQALKKGNSIIIDNYVDNGEISPGVFNRTFGAYSLSENGTILRDIKFDTFDSEMVLSPDGSKLAYLEGSYQISGSVKAKVVDLKNGEIKEIMQNEFITNLQWDASGKFLSFATGNSRLVSPIDLVRNINTYIVKFDN